MTSNVQHQIWAGKQVGLVGIAMFVLAGFCFGQPAVSLSPKDGPPTTNLRVSGSGFTPYAAIDIYFDSKGEALAIANGAGAFSQIAIQAPASARPGTHWVSVVERSGHLATQEQFEVNVNWTEFHTKDMRRWNPYENVLNVDNVGSLQLKGSVDIGSGSDGVESSPAVVNGVVYVGWSYSPAGSHPPGGPDCCINFYALCARTGEVLWSADAGPYWYSSPAVANGVVYVGYDLSALDARTGAKLWSYPTGGGWSSPAVVNGVVYTSSDYDRSMNALNARTGALLWSYPTGDFVASSPAVANGVVYVASDNGNGGGNLYALNASTGAKLWSYPTGGASSSPAVEKGVVYIGSDDGNFFALNANTGAKLWSYPTGGAFSSPAVAKGVVYIGSDDGSMYALNARTGALLWSYPTGSSIDSSPAVANGVVYVGSWDGNVYALNASTGAKLWSYPTGGGFSSPAVVNGVVYVGSSDGKVYAFGLPRGLAEQEADRRPDLKALHPDFDLKVVQPVATPSGAD